MGVDYCRISLKPGVDPEAVRPLVERQAEAAFRYGGFFYYYQEALVGRVDPWHSDQAALEDFLRACEALEDRIVFHTIQRNGEEYRDTYRTLPITGGEIFPLEWQVAAHRTFLPDELPGFVKVWRDYLEQVERGWHRGYLTLSHVYQDWCFVREIWEELDGIARGVPDRANVWAQRPALLAVVESLASMGPPPDQPLPRWTAWRDRPQAPLDPEDAQRAAAWLDFRARLETVIRGWNSRVPSKHKIPLSRLGKFNPIEPWIAEHLADDYRRDFFDWLDDCCAHGHGLYYWA
jgi:hypothetical protein